MVFHEIYLIVILLVLYINPIKILLLHQLPHKLLSYIPLNNLDDPPFFEYTDNKSRQDDSLNKIIPENPNKPYDMHKVINTVSDKDSFFEVHKDFAKNILVGFARIGGRAVGIIANQPAHLAGVLELQEGHCVSCQRPCLWCK